MSNRNIIDAKIDDGEEILKLMEATSAKGAFELISTKRPNPYESFQRESKDVSIGLIKDKEGHIVVQFACVVREYYINGKVMKVGYVCNVRKKADYRGIIDWRRMSQYVKAKNCDLYLCSFLKSNEDALKLFAKKKRSCFPELFKVCNYRTYIINPKVVKVSNEVIGFRSITKNDLDNVKRFINKEAIKYNFTPVVNDIESEFFGLKLDDCYIIERNSEIVAFGALWEQTSYKQYVVTKYNGYMKVLKKLSKFSEWLGYISIPKEDIPLKFPTITLAFSKDNKEGYYKALIQGLAREVEKKYKMFVIGLNSEDTNINIFENMKHLSFDSELYFVKYDRDINSELVARMECGML